MDDSQINSTADNKNPKTKLIILVAVLAVLAVAGFLVFGGGTTPPPEPSAGDTASPDPVDETVEAPDDRTPPTEAETGDEAPVQIGPPGVSSQPPPSGDGDQAGTDEPPADANQDPGSETETSVAPAAGRYLDAHYEDQPRLQAELAQLAGQERWLSFHADWCPQCRALDADINANLDQIPAGVTIVKIDFDDNQSLRQQYRVTQQTTIVRVGADNQVVGRYVAYSQPTLANVIAGLGS